LAFQELAEQSYGGNRISPLLDQHIENGAFIVHGAPEPHSLAIDLHDHFIQMPPAGWPGSRTSEVLSEQPAP
jgi:hypothetical protein